MPLLGELGFGSHTSVQSCTVLRYGNETILILLYRLDAQGSTSRNKLGSIMVQLHCNFQKLTGCPLAPAPPIVPGWPATPLGPCCPLGPPGPAPPGAPRAPWSPAGPVGPWEEQ